MPTININENLIYKYYAPNEYNLDALLNHYFCFILTLAKKFNVDVYEIDLSQTDFHLTKKLIRSKVNA